MAGPMVQVSRVRLITTILVVVWSTLALTLCTPATASLPGPSVVKATGFDTCSLPSTTDMAKWWADTNYWAIGVYIGGENSGSCPSGVNHAWLSTVMTQGWRVWLLWVGPQNPCVFQPLATFSTDPNTATSQAESEASSAVTAANNLGFSDEYIVYDMEGFNTGNSTCVTAGRSFVNGWEYEIHTLLGKHGAVYGSSCASDIDGYKYHSNVPEAIFPADYSDSPKAVYGLSCIPDADWSFDQRVHQWTASTPIRIPPGDPTWTIDEDCLDGPVQGNPASPGCV